MKDQFTDEEYDEAPLPKLTHAQIERLALLSEELGEAQMAIGKILRHGYHSRNPFKMHGLKNYEALEVELGDILLAIEYLTASNDPISTTMIQRARKDAAFNKPRWLHHQATDTKEGE